MKRKRLELKTGMLEARELTARLLIGRQYAALKSIAAEKDAYACVGKPYL